MSYFFHPKARIEHLEHVAYYESQQKGLGALPFCLCFGDDQNLCRATSA
jgi:hypothetical protein